LDFIEKCLQKEPYNRSTAKELLMHPFILKGCSTQILEPLVKKCLPVLIPRREEDLKEEMDEDIVQKGTVLAVDKTTYQAEVLSTGSGRGTVKKSRSMKEEENEESENAEEDVVNIIDQIIDHLSAEGLDVEGLFRIGASTKTINDIRASFRNGQEVDLSNFDAHAVAGALKVYLRELPDPLLLPIYKKYKEQVDSKKISDATQYLVTIKTLVNQLDPTNKEVLQKLVRFLALVAEHSEANTMNASNLAKCLGANLVFKKDETPETILQNSTYVNHLLQTLIEHHKKIF